jgi:ubiquinone/menaquinone biosynthesis C-methylase UbiE
MIRTIKSFLQKTAFPGSTRNSVEAYELWSENYDKQPGNLMLDLDERIFGDLIENIDLKDKGVADIGCGTGRHWGKLYEKHPSFVMGFDVSSGMLQQLLRKFPSALTHHTTDNLMKQVPDSFVDCLVSTLTIGHIENIDEAMASWSRVLRPGGNMIITDFHPEMLSRGGKRSFRHKGRNLSVVNHIHPVEKLKEIFKKYELNIIRLEERRVDEKVKMYYEVRQALPVYDRFIGVPIIYGIHLRK